MPRSYAQRTIVELFSHAYCNLSNFFVGTLRRGRTSSVPFESSRETVWLTLSCATGNGGDSSPKSSLFFKSRDRKKIFKPRRRSWRWFRKEKTSWKSLSEKSKRNTPKYVLITFCIVLLGIESWLMFIKRFFFFFCWTTEILAPGELTFQLCFFFITLGIQHSNLQIVWNSCVF